MGRVIVGIEAVKGLESLQALEKDGNRIMTKNHYWEYTQGWEIPGKATIAATWRKNGIEPVSREVILGWRGPVQSNRLQPRTITKLADIQTVEGIEALEREGNRILCRHHYWEYTQEWHIPGKDTIAATWRRNGIEPVSREFILQEAKWESKR